MMAQIDDLGNPINDDISLTEQITPPTAHFVDLYIDQAAELVAKHFGIDRNNPEYQIHLAKETFSHLLRSREEMAKMHAMFEALTAIAPQLGMGALPPPPPRASTNPPPVSNVSAPTNTTQTLSMQTMTQKLQIIQPFISGPVTIPEPNDDQLPPPEELICDWFWTQLDVEA